MGDVADTITDFARARLGHRVGRGECFDLADQALKKAGMRTASDYDKITADGDYRWGVLVELKKAQAGDILQFRNHSAVVDTVTVTRETDARGGFTERTETKTQTFTRDHHTAIVKSNLGGSVLTIYEQNAKPRGRVVQEQSLYVADQTTTVPAKVSTKHTKAGLVTVEVRSQTMVTVKGTLWVYRPEAK